MAALLRRLVVAVVFCGLVTFGLYIQWSYTKMDPSNPNVQLANQSDGASKQAREPTIREFSYEPGDEECKFSLSWCTMHYSDFMVVNEGSTLVWKRNNCTYHAFTPEETKKRVRSLRLASAGDSVSRDIAYYMLAQLDIDTKMPKKSHQSWHVVSGGFSFHNWWLYHLGIQMFNLKSIMKEAPDIFIFNSGVWETTWFWSPQNFPYPPGLHFTTDNRTERVEQFLENYNKTVHKFAREIATFTAKRVWDDKDRCYKTGKPIFIYRTTLRLNCQGSLWMSKMSITPCPEVQALVDRMNRLLFPAFRRAGVLVLVTDELFKTPTSCPRGDGVHPDKSCHKKLNSLVVNVIAAAMRQKNKCVCTTPPKRITQSSTG